MNRMRLAIQVQRMQHRIARIAVDRQRFVVLAVHGLRRGAVVGLAHPRDHVLQQVRAKGIVAKNKRRDCLLTGTVWADHVPSRKLSCASEVPSDAPGPVPGRAVCAAKFATPRAQQKQKDKGKRHSMAQG